MSQLFDATGAPVLAAALTFLLVAGVTVWGSVRLAGLGDRLADRTGWGEAFFGAVLFGVITSLSGIVMTATAAFNDRPELAYSNAVGGIAAQTLAIAVADLAYRRANLEHAAASSENLAFGCLLVALLGLALVGSHAPEATIVGLHPVSFVMVGIYLGALHLIRQHAEKPMWLPVRTRETVLDEPDVEAEPGTGTPRLWISFLLVASVVAGGGYLTAKSAGYLVDVTGLGAGFVGAVLMGLVNALPEAVTAVAAVKRGAVTLAVAAILGGNCLDALNLVVGDAFFRGGSIMHRAGDDQLLATAIALVMTAILLGGLVLRQRKGWGRIGFEGPLLVAAYVALVAAQLG